MIKNHIGAELAIVVKTVEDFRQILNENPFSDDTYENSKTFFALYHGELPKDKIEAVKSIELGEEQIVFGNNALYYYLPEGASRSKVTNNFLERKLKSSLTSRNQNTMQKLLALAENRPNSKFEH